MDFSTYVSDAPAEHSPEGLAVSPSVDSSLALPAHDRSGSSSLTPVEDGGIFLIRACGLLTRSAPTLGVGLDGLVPRTERAVLGGRPCTSSDVRDFRSTHGPRMTIDYLSSPSGRFVARVSASAATVDRRPGLRVISPVANTAFATGFGVPFGGNQGSAEAPAAATFAAQRAPPPTSTSQGEDSTVNTAPAASAPSGWGSADAPAAATIIAQRAPPPTSTLQGIY